MTMTDATKTTNKALPFKNAIGYTAMPNEVLKIFVGHPKFDGKCVLVYLYLLDKYNANFKYAFPTQDQIADETFISRQSVIRALAVLEELNLIQAIYNTDYGNNVYVFKKPITNREEFEQQFPEVVDYRLKFEASRTKDKEKRHERKADYQAKVQEIFESANS